MERVKTAEALPGNSGGRLPGRSTEETGREEGEEDEGSGERQIRHESMKEVNKSSQKMAVEESLREKKELEG